MYVGFHFGPALSFNNRIHILYLQYIFKIGIHIWFAMPQWNDSAITEPSLIFIGGQSKAAAVGATSNNICRKAFTPSMNFGTYPYFTNGR